MQHFAVEAVERLKSVTFIRHSRYTAKRLTDEFPEKSWTKHGVNKLLKNLRDTGTVGIATKCNHTTTGPFQSHPHFTKENNYAFECLIF